MLDSQLRDLQNQLDEVVASKAERKASKRSPTVRQRLEEEFLKAEVRAPCVRLCLCPKERNAVRNNVYFAFQIARFSLYSTTLYQNASREELEPAVSASGDAPRLSPLSQQQRSKSQMQGVLNLLRLHAVLILIIYPLCGLTFQFIFLRYFLSYSVDQHKTAKIDCFF